MGKEFPLARKEKQGCSVLLVSPSTRELITTSYSGDQRTQEPTPSKVSKRGKVKDIKTKSKSSRKTERANASSSKSQRGRRDNKNRKSDRGDEGADKPVRRSSSELGITFPSSYCDEIETAPHYWIEVDNIDGGSLFQCRYCRNYLWLPSYYLDAYRLGDLIRKCGRDEGYCQYLNKHRTAKVLVAKLQDLRKLEAEFTDKREFARLVDKILSDKEYDRKEVR